MYSPADMTVCALSILNTVYLFSHLYLVFFFYLLNNQYIMRILHYNLIYHCLGLHNVLYFFTVVLFDIICIVFYSFIQKIDSLLNMCLVFGNSSNPNLNTNLGPRHGIRREGASVSCGRFA